MEQSERLDLVTDGVSEVEIEEGTVCSAGCDVLERERKRLERDRGGREGDESFIKMDPEGYGPLDGSSRGIRRAVGMPCAGTRVSANSAVNLFTTYIFYVTALFSPFNISLPVPVIHSRNFI